jgi:hypothetical protein
MTRDPSHFWVVAAIPAGWECSKCKCGWHDRESVAACPTDTQKAVEIDWFGHNASFAAILKARRS